MSYKFVSLLVVTSLALSGCGGGGGGSGGQPANKAPVASFTANPSSGPAPLRVNVDARQSTDSDGSIASFEWIFGDGQSATGPIASHVYDKSGNYEIQLTVRDNQGAGSTAASTVSVTSAPPVAAFTAVPNSGIAPLLVSFDASASSDMDGSIASYTWTFGDGGTGTGQKVTHTYGSAPTFRSSDYAVVLTVRDNSGLEGTVTHPVTVAAPPIVPPNVPPVARVSAAPSTGNAPLAVTFNGSASTDADGSISSYTWAFGDGQSGSGAVTQHVYAAAGAYTAVLSVVDNAGALGQAATPISVTAPQNQPPVAAFSASPNGGTSPVDVAFDASASSDPDGTITTYAWTFGDGSPGASGKTTTHTYSAIGKHVAVLTVTDNKGATAQAEQVIQITAANTYTVGGTVSGLTGTGLVLQNGGIDDLPINTNGTFTFGRALASGAPYSVTVKTQPSGPTQTCTVTNGTGNITGANVTSVTVTCTTNTYTVGGTVSGLAGTGFVLQNNGADDLAIASNGTFTFKTAITSGATYRVSIKAQPTGPIQTCTVNSGSGTVASANVSNVTVTCPAGTYSVGGTVSGLSGTGLVLQNNGVDDLPVVANGTFTFATPIASGSVYNVTVKTQPATPTQTCTVANGSGTIAAANVSNVTLTCTVIGYTVGGTVSGLTSTGLVLENNGTESLPIGANGAFVFATPLPSGASYSVTVKTQPSGTATCGVANGSGTIAGTNVTNVTVTCKAQFAYVTNSGGDSISAYSINAATGSLTSVGTVAAEPSPDFITIDSAGRFAYVVNEKGSEVPSEVWVYAINSTSGIFTSVGPPAQVAHASWSIALHPSGRFAYVPCTGVIQGGASQGIYGFAINAQGSLTSLGAPFDAPRLAYQVVIHPGGNYAYAISSNPAGSLEIVTYDINTSTGALTRVGVPANDYYPSLLAIDPIGRFLYVGTNMRGTVVYSIDAATGLLSNAGTPVNALSGRLAVDPAGRFLYESTNISSDVDGVAAFTINASTGALTAVGGPVAAGKWVSSIYPTGRFLYTTNSGDSTVSSYTINTNTGALTKVGPNTPTGQQPSSLATTR